MKKSKTGITYFFIHACIETVCFYCLYANFPSIVVPAYLVSVLYDVFAFIPQGFMGNLFNKGKFPDIDIWGLIFMGIGVALASVHGTWISIIGLLCLALGNAALHECGAIATVTTGGGRIFPSALFVAGGSFGLITGKTLAMNGISEIFIIIPFVTVAVIVLMSSNQWINSPKEYPEYNAVEPDIKPSIVIWSAFIITAVRGFIGYGIPTAWVQSQKEAFALYFSMGAGKALGGWLSDRYGYRKVGCISTVACVPFLIAGNRLMFISVIGVALFSMTMSITFGMVLSVMRNNPGKAFGVTTAGLAVGSIPAIFLKFSNNTNVILIVAGSISCFVLFLVMLRPKRE